MYQPSTNNITIKKQPQPSNPLPNQFPLIFNDDTQPQNYMHFRMQIHYLLFKHFHFILFYFITYTPPIRPTMYNIYAIFHLFITIYYAHIYYLTPLLLFTPLLFYFISFYCIHTTYEIHSIQFLRYIPFSYYYLYNTIPPLYILHQHIYTTLFIPIVTLAHHTRLQIRFSLIPHNLQRW